MEDSKLRLQTQRTKKIEDFLYYLKSKKVILEPWRQKRRTEDKMDKTNYAEITLGSNNRNDANFVSKWFFWYLNPIFTKGSKEKAKN